MRANCVMLVTDGTETCNGITCQGARARMLVTGFVRRPFGPTKRAP
jgi:hypothetical protein